MGHSKRFKHLRVLSPKRNDVRRWSHVFLRRHTVVYALDSYRDSSNEIFIMNMVFKNFLYYGLSNFVSHWTTDAGPGEVMSVFGGSGFFLVCFRFEILG
jgi:hypothetical protein